MHLQLTVPPNPLAILPAEEVATFLRVDDPTQMAEISRLIRAAFTKFQDYTCRQIATATYKMTLQRFPGCNGYIRIPYPPTISVVSFGYYAESGSTVEYQIVKDEIFWYLKPGSSGFWPTPPSGLANAIEVVFTCGYGSTRESVDEDLIHSLKVLIAHWYENREAGDLPDFILNLWGSWYTGEQG